MFTDNQLVILVVSFAQAIMILGLLYYMRESRKYTECVFMRWYRTNSQLWVQREIFRRYCNFKGDEPEIVYDKYIKILKADPVASEVVKNAETR